MQLVEGKLPNLPSVRHANTVKFVIKTESVLQRYPHMVYKMFFALAALMAHKLWVHPLMYRGKCKFLCVGQEESHENKLLFGLTMDTARTGTGRPFVMFR